MRYPLSSYDYVTSSRSNVVGTVDEPHYEISDHSTRITNGHRASAMTPVATNQSGLSPTPRYETNESFVASNSAPIPSPSQHYAVSYATPGITQSRNFMEVNSHYTVYVDLLIIFDKDMEIFWQFDLNIWQDVNLASTVHGRSIKIS